MNKENYLSLRHSESVVAGMAATIFAGYIQTRQINETNEEAYIKKAVDAALKIANYADKMIKSDEEWMRPEDRGSSIL